MKRTVISYILGISLAIAFAILFRVNFFEAYRVPIGVMRPSLYAGDLIFVQKYGMGEKYKPHYGDILIFQIPKYADTQFIKRVIGLPGDEIALKMGILQFNGQNLEQKIPDKELFEWDECGREIHPFARYSICRNPNKIMKDLTPTRIPEGHVFVIGDDRTRELSKVDYYILPFSEVRGKARRIWLSIESENQTPRLRWNRIFKPIN